MIEILRCGPLTTVQDLGRHGLRHLGVSQTGALDPIAMQQANLLSGNLPGAAVLELSVGPLVMRFHRDSVIALTGIEFTATRTAQDRPAESMKLLPGYAAQLQAGDVVTLSRSAVPGARAYLAVAGGIDVPLVLGSRSTDLNAGFGGLEGRQLRAGSLLPVGSWQALGCLDGCLDGGLEDCTAKKGLRPLSPSHILRALPGPDYEAFTTDSQVLFWSQPWRISHQSNRMGMRLNGTVLELEEALELPSAGVLPGDVQVPPGGLPIVLANDAQTIGGYPRIASVIQADLWQLAHMPPCTSVYFVPVSLAEAAAATARQMQYLRRLTERLRPER